jgi:hypothetical protein
MENEERLINQLEECLAAVRAGESAASCLERYPDNAQELAPLLQISLALEGLPQPGPARAAAQVAKSEFLASAEQKSAMQPGIFVSLWAGIKRVFSFPASLARMGSLATMVAALAVAVLIGWGVIQASSGSLPGDPLYAFKLLGEDIQRAFTFDQDSFGLDTAFGERRHWEVERLLTQAHQQPVQFGGIVRQQSTNLILVEDIPVVLDASTAVQGELGVGAFVTVDGQTQQNVTVLAHRIEVRGERIVGVIQLIVPAEWRVDSKRIRIDDATLIVGRFQEGDCVEVHTRLYADDVLYAQEIVRGTGCRDDGDQMPPTPTPIPTLDPTTLNAPQDETPTPTRTPRPTATPTATPSATAAPPPTMTPPPSATPRPPEEPAATSAPEPTDAPKPTAPEPPTAVPQPTSPPEPTDAPEPTEDVRPTEEPEPTDDDDDDDDHDPDPSDQPEPPDDPDHTREPHPTDRPEPTDDP